MRVGHRIVDVEAKEVLGFVDFDLRGKDLREYQADPDKWHRDVNEVLVHTMRSHHAKREAERAAEGNMKHESC